MGYVLLIVIAVAAVYILFMREYFVGGKFVKGYLAKRREEAELAKSITDEEVLFAEFEKRYRHNAPADGKHYGDDAQGGFNAPSAGDQQVVINCQVGKQPVEVMRVILENVGLFTEVSNNATPRDVKDFVDSCRGAVKIVTHHVSMEDAQKAYQLLTQAGAKAEVWACRS